MCVTHLSWSSINITHNIPCRKKCVDSSSYYDCALFVINTCSGQSFTSFSSSHPHQPLNVIYHQMGRMSRMSHGRAQGSDPLVGTYGQNMNVQLRQLVGWSVDIHESDISFKNVNRSAVSQPIWRHASCRNGNFTRANP